MLNNMSFVQGAQQVLILSFNIFDSFRHQSEVDIIYIDLSKTFDKEYH